MSVDETRDIDRETVSQVGDLTGRRVQGRYRVIIEIGHGGMGAVFEAFDERLRCVVALKQMKLASADGAEAFAHEARVLAGLRCPGLPLVTDFFAERTASCTS